MSNNPLCSPRVTHISWGLATGCDFKLYTHHVPGIHPADVEELLEHGSKVVVLTRRMQLVLQMISLSYPPPPAKRNGCNCVSYN